LNSRIILMDVNKTKPMLYLLRRIYTIYSLLIFCLTFLIILPFLLLCIWIPNFEKYGRKINRYWAFLYFKLIFLNVDVKGRENVIKGHPYVFIANHFSYIDIPMMGLLPGDVVFIGKSSISSVPLFGYYFKKLHVMVERSSIKSRGEALSRAKKAIEKGSSIVIFPEGGITSPEPPKMKAFKDGAFVIAIEKQIPIIPVTLSYNHLILPDDGKLLLNLIKGKMIIHSPLETISYLDKDVSKLKELCFNIIQSQLIIDNPLKENVKIDSYIKI